MRFLFLIFCFISIGCEDTKIEKMHDMHCIERCIDSKFKKFHSASRQLLGGAASSSMSGIQQTDIYKIIRSECVADYKNNCNVCHYSLSPRACDKYMEAGYLEANELGIGVGLFYGRLKQVK